MAESPSLPKCEVTSLFDMDKCLARTRYDYQHNTDTNSLHMAVNVLDMESGASYRQFSSEVLECLKLEKTHVLGHGYTGRVWMVEDATTRGMYKYAAKVFSFKGRKGKKLKKTFLHECGIIQSLKHGNIVQFSMAVAGPTYGVLLFEYYPEGTLYRHIKDLPILFIWKYFVSIMNAVNYLHDKRIVHRDLKLDNVLVKDRNVFLTDFGFSEKLQKENNSVKGFCGTRVYAAPEVIDSGITDKDYDGFKADSFAMGVLLWSLLMRREPDRKTNPLLTLLMAVESGAVEEIALVDCVRVLLLDDPYQRVTVFEVLHCLNRYRYTDLLNEKMDVYNKINHSSTRLPL